MNISVKPGFYVVAVSGGVDSVVLLDILAKQPDCKLVVAHFDHGIRPESTEDCDFVAKLTKQYDLPFEKARAELGSEANENQAREARYEFLRKIRKKYNTDAIATAHHQDDVLETIIFNVMRGTGIAGVTTLTSDEEFYRPLLGFSKKDIKKYAAEHHLKWREDASNLNPRYTRNSIRQLIMPKLDQAQREALLALRGSLKDLRELINPVLDSFLQHAGNRYVIDYKTFQLLPQVVDFELLTLWLRKNGLRDFDKKTIERLATGLKTLKPGKRIEIMRGKYAVIKDGLIQVSSRSSEKD